MNYKTNRKYSEDVIKLRIQQSKDKVISDLKNKNIPFELVDDNYKNRSTRTIFKCLKCGALKYASAHNVINNHDGCLKCGKKKRRTFEEFVQIAKNDGYEVLSEKSELKSEKSELNTNKIVKFKHSCCGTIFELRLYKFLETKAHCPTCKNNSRITDLEFIQKLNSIYGNLFTLAPNCHYEGRHKMVSLTCNKCHHITTDIVSNFLTNHRGCNFCSKSISEQIILNYYNQDIKTQIKFNNLKYIENLFYDFEKK